MIHMVSGPRNMSTAIMYSFHNRHDTVAVDEPFYACYLYKNPNVNHPGRKEILSSQSKDTSQVISELNAAAKLTEYLFVKNMAHHIGSIDHSYMYDVKNILLIRDPALLIKSFTKVVTNPTMKDIGVYDEYRLYHDLKNHNNNPIVIDSSKLLDNPEDVLTRLCNALDIPFDDRMLCWESGPKEIDGVWAPYWYSNVHKSTGYKIQNKSNIELDYKYAELLQEANRYYQELLNESI